MATKLVNGRKVLVDSQADPGSRKFLRESGGKQVTFADGTQLNALDSKNYGKSPTVLTNAGIIEDKIPSLRNKTAQLPMLGEPQATDGAPQEESDFSIDEVLGISKKDKKKDAWDNLRERQDARANGTDGNDDPMFDQMMGLLDEQKKISDRKTKEDIFRIESSMKRLRADQMQANSSGLAGLRNALGRAGASRYAPGGAAGVMSAASTAGVRALADLNMQEQELISQARSAQESSDYQLLEKKLGLIDSVRKEKAATAAALEKDMREKTIQSSRDSAIANLYSQGVTDPAQIVDMLNFTENGEQVGDITLAEVGDALKILNVKKELDGEYAQYVKEAEQFGQTPVDINSFYKLAGASGGALTKEQKQDLNTIRDDMRVDPDVKDFVSIRDGYERVQTGADMNNAQGDLSLLFGYMKLLDPTSVVRETEFANAEAAMGYAQQVLNLPNKAISGNRLTEQARKDFSTAAKRLYERKKQSYDKAINFYGSVAESYDLDPAMIIRDQGTTIGNEIIQTEEQAKQKIIDLGTSDTTVRRKVEQILTENPDVTYTDLLDVFEIPHQKVSTGTNRPQRNNNPFNIKASDATLAYPGAVGKDPEPATDGGQFIVFATPDDGFAAGERLLMSSGYKNLSVDAAMKRWSGGGYGAEIVPQLKGKTIAQLTKEEIRKLLDAMARREGYFA